MFFMDSVLFALESCLTWELGRAPVVWNSADLRSGSSLTREPGMSHFSFPLHMRERSTAHLVVHVGIKGDNTRASAGAQVLIIVDPPPETVEQECGVGEV